LSNRPHRLAA